MKDRGFTLVEVVLAAAIVAIIASALAAFFKDTLWQSRTARERISSQITARKTLGSLVRDLRSADSIQSVSTSTVIFYLDGELESRALDSGSFSYAEPVMTIVFEEGGKEYSATIVLRNLESDE